MSTTAIQNAVDEMSIQSSSSDSSDDENDLLPDHRQKQNQRSTAMYEKDSDEEELERLVLGDQASFRDNLFATDLSANDGRNGDPTAAIEDFRETAGLEGIDDADLFMLDTIPSGAAAGLPRPGTLTEGSDKADKPAWYDSDDDRLTISLAAEPRLRKLRISEADDVLSGTEYRQRLRQQYLLLRPQPTWTVEAGQRPTKRRRRSSAGSSASSSNDSEGSDSEVSAQPLEQFLRDVNKLASLGMKRRKLRPEVIDIQRTREIPDKHKAPVASLSFHPSFPVLLSCSTASILYLHHIAPEARPTPNPQLTSVQVKQVDTRRAEFQYPHGDKIFFAGRRKYFHQWDLQSGVVQKTSRIHGHQLEHKSMERFRLSPCGTYMAIIASSKKAGGIVNILNASSMQWIAAARISSRSGVADFAWWSTGEGLTILGRDGQVGEYSLENRGFLGIWHDEGCIGGIVLALGGHNGNDQLGGDRWVTVGSNSGITNIYDRRELIEPSKDSEVTIKSRPTPTRTFEQLITPITIMTFSPDGQLFAFGSQHKKDALKLVHLPTCTIYRNWPTQQTPLGRITAMEFGRESDLLAIGNDAGKIRLWQIRN